MPAEELRSWVSQRVTPSAVGKVARGLVNLLDDLADEQLSALRAQGLGQEDQLSCRTTEPIAAITPG